MSREKTHEEYSRTKSYRFFRWLSGSKDPYLGEVELKPQKEDEHFSEKVEAFKAEREEAIDKVYDLEHNKYIRTFDKLYRIVAVVFCIFLCVLLLITVSNLPPAHTSDRPTNNEVARRYIEQGLDETGATNIVSGMILTYRAFDTFGETNVLFVATCCVMILLMLEEETVKKQDKLNDRRFEPKDDKILKGSAYLLCPLIFIFGIYIILNGQLSPGGGFSGGAILGAGMILYVSAFGFTQTGRFFNEHIYKIAKISALLTYGLIGSYYYITGANGIANHIPLGRAGAILSGGIILPINIAVGVEVACTMYAFYALFKRGGL